MEIISKRFKDLNIEELYEILQLRSQVFVVEQECIYQDLDGKDKNALHLYIRDKGAIVAYLRVLEKGISHKQVAIGRVLSVERNKGLAKKLLQEAIRIIMDVLGEEEIVLEAQTYIKKMYEDLGFEVCSNEFLEDGIPHVKMILRIK